ncbi:hypothetical protein CcaverHIS641_0508340 [Cutaneotrichosporon cavernicola]|nr:hypothetical protein CcaverHIS641_0508340 [Cutaneotrichosporon cavernicola]
MPGIALAKRLVNLSTCEISDALIKMGVSHGGLIPDIKMYSPLYEAGETRIAGPAFTVEENGPIRAPRQEQARHALC